MTPQNNMALKLLAEEMMTEKTTEAEPGWYTAYVFLMGMLAMGILAWLIAAF